MDLSKNPLTSKQKEFLLSENTLGFNKSQYQADITHHLEKSVGYIHHILNNNENLKKSEIYDVVNALTLEKILDNCIKTSKGSSYEYDFRTVELARLFFESSAKYLKNSPYFIEDQFAQKEIERAIQHFQNLSRSILLYHSHEVISEQEENQIREKIMEIEIKLKEFVMSNKKLNELQLKIDKLFSSSLKSIDAIKSYEEKIEKMKNSGFDDLRQASIYQGMVELDKFRVKENEKDLKKNQSEMNKNQEYVKLKKELFFEQNKIFNKYEKLKKYSCSINPISVFVEKKEKEFIFPG